MYPNMYTAAMKGDSDALNQYSADQFALQLTLNGNTVLHVAAQCGRYRCLPAILCKCPSLLLRVNDNGDLPIHVAMARGSYGTVRSLIDFAKSAEGGGAAAVREMLRARNHDGDTPLHLAARLWMVPVLQFFDSIGTLLTKEDPWLDHGPNKAGETPLYLYVDRRYNVDVLSLMLKTCTPPEYGGPNGRTALHAAVIRYKHKFIDKLIEWKIDLIKEPDADGRTPLHYAAENGDVEVVKKLLDKDESVAYVTANNDEGNTALHTATAKGHAKVMKELLSKCPDCWEMVNGKGKNTLHISADWERDEATKYISEQPWVYGLVNRKDHEGNTPLHVLAHNYKVQQNWFFLFVAAADMEALNNEALTPYEILFHKMGDRKYWLLQKKFLRGLDEKDQGGKGMMNNREHKEQREKEKQKAAEEMSKMAKTHIIVATLISTISFAAGFTIPGGYEVHKGPNEGMAVLVRDAAFKAFVITNTIAMICSTSSVFLYVSASLFNIRGIEGERRVHRYEIAFWLRK